jgi:hypothetical protein
MRAHIPRRSWNPQIYSHWQKAMVFEEIVAMVLLQHPLIFAHAISFEVEKRESCLAGRA